MVGVLEQNDYILEKYEKEIQLVNKKDDVEVANKSNEVNKCRYWRNKTIFRHFRLCYDINGIESGKNNEFNTQWKLWWNQQSTNALKTDDTVQSKETVLSYNKTDLNSPLKSEESFFTKNLTRAACSGT